MNITIRDLIEITTNDIIVVEKVSDDKIVIGNSVENYLDCVIVELESIDFKQLIVYI